MTDWQMRTKRPLRGPVREDAGPTRVGQAMPQPHEGDTDIEIRQILEPEDFASAFNDEEIQKEKNFRAQMAARAAKK